VATAVQAATAVQVSFFFTTIERYKMADYTSTLTGAQMDAALEDMAEHDSEAWAVGERNGTAVTSEDETYQNNSKYFKEQAEFFSNNGTIRINGTSYQVRTATSGGGQEGYITFVLG